jgi:hypothetical protein
MAPTPPAFITEGSIVSGELISSGDDVLASGLVSFNDQPWSNFSVEVDVATNDNVGVATIRIGRLIANEAASATLTLDWRTQQANLAWGFQATPNSGLEGRTESFDRHVSLENVWHRVRLGMMDGDILAAISLPSIWSSEAAELSSIVFAGSDRIALSADDRSTAIDSDLQSADSTDPGYETSVAETRSWEPADSDLTWLGVCLPNEHQILVRPQDDGTVQWPQVPRLSVSPTLVIGGQVGQAAGEMLLPVSFDASSDGRIYVLDAGNGRIQVFDSEANYITEWGTRGSAEGQFDFGVGVSAEDFTGSIAVDDEGFIYVADVGNQRIQKFAP